MRANHYSNMATTVVGPEEANKASMSLLIIERSLASNCEEIYELQP